MRKSIKHRTVTFTRNPGWDYRGRGEPYEGSCEHNGGNTFPENNTPERPSKGSSGSEIRKTWVTFGLIEKKKGKFNAGRNKGGQGNSR